MRKIYTLLATILFSLTMTAQAPEKMSYQAVIRDVSDALIVSSPIGIQISILEGSSTGNPVYVETQTPTTNANGLISIEVGSGTVVSGAFNTINWGNNSYYIQTDVDPTGGTTYSLTGTSQLLSVPYALFSKSSAGIAGAEWTTSGNNINNTNTGNVGIGNAAPTHTLSVMKTSGSSIGVGSNAFNNNNSGTLVFGEDLDDQNGDCGFKFYHNGSSNTLALISGCYIPSAGDTIATYYRSGHMRIKKLSLGGLSSNQTAPTNQFAVQGISDFNGNVNINGDLNITGNIAKGSGTFKIDHPLNPKNQYLIHSFVESPEMMNIYSGNVKTDNNGYVTVTLPAYFEAANKDFRYQLTTIGTFAQAIIKEKVSGNKFVIQTSIPNVEVSWQITAVRADKFANENRIVPEKEKEFKGTYLHPELYGAGKEQSETFVRNQKAIQEAETKATMDGQ
ncbi:conserved exported hypothetical protein [Flavobacterium sp. 9AF]|uniref:hypothetical protein n=1 Tax=Flavobacterium sp. 9AF TaxID=2653142 RepID=UPI0012F06277|nr:hypothetical protein [Flavobacterium sp. 9AF]VXB93840.1 conserved exported hypothetical protein [Flavobacterium sp. 9AF]